jgi:hypothetical protein
MALSFIQPITLSLSLLQRMASNNDDKHTMEEEAESSMARKRLWLSDDDSSDSLEEEEEVSSEESSMNQLDTSKEKLYAKRARSILFSNDGDTPSTSLEPCTPGSR